MGRFSAFALARIISSLPLRKIYFKPTLNIPRVGFYVVVVGLTFLVFFVPSILRACERICHKSGDKALCSGKASDEA